MPIITINVNIKSSALSAPELSLFLITYNILLPLINNDTISIMETTI
jgi:hypothetical protein